MSASNNYIEKNQLSWNARTPVHVNSEFYDVKGFLEGKSSLNEIELGLLGNIRGKSILHLQCHFGQDSISLARLGADVVGVDFSDKAIDMARQLASDSNVSAEFICSNIFDLNQHLDRDFDLVFTSYGTIAWFPDLQPWAALISKYLRPGGKFVFVEFHPVVWMFDNDFKNISYRYFKGEPIEELESGTYAEPSAAITTQSITWNHGLAEVIGALLQNNFTINSFEEYDYSPYNCMMHMEEVTAGKFRIKTMDDKLPLVYSIGATKN